MKLTVLIENTASVPALHSEHGLSVHIGYRGHSILLDAGSSGAFAGNAAALGVDLAGVELAVLSHGHYDHADGLRRFFRENGRAPVYCRPTADGEYFSTSKGAPRFVGIHRELLAEHAGRFRPVEGLAQPLPGVWLVPRTRVRPEFASRERHLTRKVGPDRFVPDDFSHEQSLVLEGEQGLILLNSCSHGGIVNIVDSVLEQLPGRRVYAVWGGLHMYSPGANELNCPPEYVTAVADELDRLGVREVYTGHCTGQRAFQLLRDRLGDRVRPLAAGLTAEYGDGSPV